MTDETKDSKAVPQPAVSAPQPKTPAPAPAPQASVVSAAAPAVQRPVSAPVKPSGSKVSPERRQFIFSWLALAWVAFAAATAAALSTTLRFLFPNVLFEQPTSFKAGKPDEYDAGLVDERWKDKFGVWIVRTPEIIYALSTVCTHLGCTPSWLSAEQKFKCPCHGSGFYKTGINFEGPAPRPLERYKISIADDGQIVVDKSKKFQQEKGEWENPESYVVV